MNELSDSSLNATTIMIYIFFLSNSILYILFHLVKTNQETIKLSISDDIIIHKKKERELSKPFIGTIDCYYNLTCELFRTGLIMLLTYICEKQWLFAHSQKTYSRDLFLFILIVFFAYAFYTIKPVHDLTLLSREQTEEWKGWMQFIFLLYHYFHAEEVYNSVRVMITCYVWMTGFGNFSFFYVKRDFGWLRVVQMLWRLNFSVLLLMWTHGNTWILYYICPMHTFYFLMVFVIMYIYSSINHSKWGIRAKLIIAGIIIYIVWDINHGIFDFIFGWLGTDSVVGATNGSVWEYYFRTSLDHWSSYLGMIFALNYPLAEQYFQRCQGGPLYVASFLFVILFITWFRYIYILEKLIYNLYHAYFAIIPLTSYIFFRNITPFIRSGVSMSLHDLGKTTLETYLLQHHIWLTSNAKTLLTIIPGHPWVNFALATILFFTVAKELYRLTMSLRGMILPDDNRISFNNCIGMTIIISTLYSISYALTLYNISLFLITLLTLFLTILIIILISYVNDLTKDRAYQYFSVRMIIGIVIIFSLGLILNYYVEDNIIYNTMNTYTKYNVNDPQCLNSISNGHWVNNDCNVDVPVQNLGKYFDHKAYCQTNEWVWDDLPADCPVKHLNTFHSINLYNNHKIVFIGDSIVRNTYHQLNKLLDPKYNQIINNSTYRHSDLHYHYSNISVAFIWAPMTSNISNYLNSNYDTIINSNVVVIGANLWDALYESSVDTYRENLNTIGKLLPNRNDFANKPLVIWLQPTSIVNDRLTTSSKLNNMNEQIVNRYRNVVYNVTALTNKLTAVINPTAVSRGKESNSVDGVHYDDEIYEIIVQMISNSIALQSPNYYLQKPKIKKSKPRPTGVMSFPMYGIIVLIISAIMLVTFDAFLGIGFLSLALFCKSFDWESVYLPLHRKLGLEFTLHEESSKDELFENENLIEEIFRTASKDKI